MVRTGSRAASAGADRAAVRLHDAQAPPRDPRASRARCRPITGATYAFTTEVLVRSYSRCSRTSACDSVIGTPSGASARPMRALVVGSRVGMQQHDGDGVRLPRPHPRA